MSPNPVTIVTDPESHRSSAPRWLPLNPSEPQQPGSAPPIHSGKPRPGEVKEAPQGDLTPARGSGQGPGTSSAAGWTPASLGLWVSEAGMGASAPSWERSVGRGEALFPNTATPWRWSGGPRPAHVPRGLCNIPWLAVRTPGADARQRLARCWQGTRCLCPSGHSYH